MDVKEATRNQELRQFTEMMDTHGYQETGKQDQETLRKTEKRKKDYRNTNALTSSRQGSFRLNELIANCRGKRPKPSRVVGILNSPAVGEISAG